MNKTVLIALLGATVSLATPAISLADSGYVFKSKALERDHNYKHKHGHKHHHHHAQVTTKTKTKIKNNKTKKSQFVYDAQGYNRQGFNKYGYNRQGYNKYGFNKNGYNKLGFDKYGYNKHGYNRYGFNQHGFNKYGYNKHGYNKQGYNRHGYSQHPTKPTKPGFSITWNVGDASITYGNVHNASVPAYVKPKPRKDLAKKIHLRINSQASLIKQGVRNGKLVGREITKLNYEQRDIQNTFSQYKRDGHLNKYESNRLNQLLNVAQQNIYQKLNNRRTRYAQQHQYNYVPNQYYVQF